MRHSESEIIDKALDQLRTNPSLIMHHDETFQEVLFIDNDDQDVTPFKAYTYKVKFVKSESYPYVWEFKEISDWYITPMVNRK